MKEEYFSFESAVVVRSLRKSNWIKSSRTSYIRTYAVLFYYSLWIHDRKSLWSRHPYDKKILLRRTVRDVRTYGLSSVSRLIKRKSSHDKKKFEVEISYSFLGTISIEKKSVQVDSTYLMKVLSIYLIFYRV